MNYMVAFDLDDWESLGYADSEWAAFTDPAWPLPQVGADMIIPTDEGERRYIVVDLVIEWPAGMVEGALMKPLYRFKLEPWNESPSDTLDAMEHALSGAESSALLGDTTDDPDR